MSVRILNREQVQRRLRKMRQQVESASDGDVLVGTVHSPVEYGPGIEFGRHPGGRLARRAGGTFALSDAVKAVKPQLADLCAESLAKGEPLSEALLAAGHQAEALTKVNLQQRLYSKPIPTSKTGRPKWKRTGNLWNAIGVTTAGGLRAALGLRG